MAKKTKPKPCNSYVAAELFGLAFADVPAFADQHGLTVLRRDLHDGNGVVLDMHELLELVKQRRKET